MKLSKKLEAPSLDEKKQALTKRIANLLDVRSVLIQVEMDKARNLEPLKDTITTIITECYKELDF